MLDPSIKLRWCKESDLDKMNEKLLSVARKHALCLDEVDDNGHDECDSPPSKKLKENDSINLFSFMTPKKKRKRALSGDPVKQEVTHYLSEPSIETDALSYWKVK